MKTTITFRDVLGMDSDLARRHDGHRVTVLGYGKGDESGTTATVACYDCNSADPFDAYPAELMLTTDRMPCTDFVYVGSDDEDGPYSRCGTHPWEGYLMGTPYELDIIGWCEDWRGIPYAELTMHDTVLHRFHTAKNNPKEN